MPQSSPLPGVQYAFTVTLQREHSSGKLTCDDHLSPTTHAGQPGGRSCPVTCSPRSTHFQVTVCVRPALARRGRQREGLRACACVRPGGSISGWTGWVGPPLPPGPEEGWGWGVTRGDSLSPLRIREGAADGTRGWQGVPTLRLGARQRHRSPGPSGRWDPKEEEAESQEGSRNRPPAPNLPRKLVRREGPGPGPRREEGRPQLHPAPLASFPALLRLLLFLL